VANQCHQADYYSLSRAQGSNTGVAMLICPGGGYHNLAGMLKGKKSPRGLTSIGVTGVILKYRCRAAARRCEGRTAIRPTNRRPACVSWCASRKGLVRRPHQNRHGRLLGGRHLVGATATHFGSELTNQSTTSTKSVPAGFCCDDVLGYFKVKTRTNYRPPSTSLPMRPPCSWFTPATTRSANRITV